VAADDEGAARLVGAGDHAVLVTAAQVGGVVRDTAARFDRAHRAWTSDVAPLGPAPGSWVTHVTAGSLSDGAPLVITVDQAAVLDGRGWHRLPDLPPAPRATPSSTSSIRPRAPTVSEGVLKREHSIAPAAVALPGARLLLTSDFADWTRAATTLQ
jgi:hypothetical protein